MTQMRRLRVLGLALVLAFPVLTSCDMLEELLAEDYDYSDPFGVANTAVGIVLAHTLFGQLDARESVLKPLADGDGTVTATFDDISGLPPFLPTSISFDQALATTATLSGTTDYPTTITLHDVRLSVRIWDSQDDLTLNFPAHANALLTHLGEGEYSMSNIQFSVDVAGSTMLRVHGIISDGGTNNVEAEINLTATSDPDLPNGAVIEMMFGSGQGRVEF